MTRCIISSNAPWANTGYANQTKHIIRGIRDLGHPVALHAWWGLEGGPTTWEGIPVYPRHFDAYGNDASAYYCHEFKADVLITLIDLWVLDPALGYMGNTKWTPLFPIDHSDPIPSVVAERFAAAHRLLVYSQYAEREVKAYDGGRYAEKVRYIPHGIETSIYRPCNPDERRGFRQRLFGDWPADAFVVGMVAANKGYPCRKSFPEAMEAFAMFAANHPEARLYLHSYAGMEFKGPDLQEMAKHFGIQDLTRLANPRLLLGGAYSDEDMRQVYCAMDVLLAPSQGEGFGLPILEAQSCGTPVLSTDHSAMTENVGVGWRVKPLRMVPTLLWGKMAEADPVGIHHALEECYRESGNGWRMQAARDFALGYDWARVLPLWGDFLNEMDGGRRELAMELTMK